jgi:hypothetical protein
MLNLVMNGIDAMADVTERLRELVVSMLGQLRAPSNDGRGVSFHVALTAIQ